MLHFQQYTVAQWSYSRCNIAIHVRTQYISLNSVWNLARHFIWHLLKSWPTPKLCFNPNRPKFPIHHLTITKHFHSFLTMPRHSNELQGLIYLLQTCTYIRSPPISQHKRTPTVTKLTFTEEKINHLYFTNHKPDIATPWKNLYKSFQPHIHTPS